MQTYDLGGVELWHADLYRLGAPARSPSSASRTPSPPRSASSNGPTASGAALPARRLMLALDFVPGDDDARRARLDRARAGLGLAARPCWREAAA